MRHTRALRVALAGLLLFATLPAAAAAGGQAVESASLEGVLVDRLGLLPEQVDRWREALVDVDGEFITFARGGDASVPPGVSLDDLPWAEPRAFGLNRVQWQDPERTPDFGGFEVVDGVLTGSVGDGPRVGPAYVVMTAILAADIPLDAGEPQQWDFVLQVPGLDQWEALPQFPDDTWSGGSFVFSLSTDGDGWSLEFVLFPNGEITRRSFPGFAIISGDTLIIGVEADPSVFDAAPAQGAPGGSGVSGFTAGRFLGGLDIAGRLALDTPQLVMATPGTRDSFFEYIGSGAVLIPGLFGLFDIIEYDVFVDEDGFIWFKLFPYTGWGPAPPFPDFYSYYVQVFLRLLGEDGEPQQAGYEHHDGERRTFSFTGSEEGDPVPAFIMDDGAILVGTNFMYDGGDLEVFVSSGFLPTEDGQFQSSQQSATVPEDEIGSTDEPTQYEDEYPIYDLVTGETVTPPPETTTTTQPASTVTTTIPATTVTTQPGTTTERPRTVVRTGETCWWCWGIIAFFAVFLITIIYLKLKTYEWWTCWIPWFIVMMVWVPFLLAALWFYRPSWWWWPLLAWFPLIGGYAWWWARRTSWWKPWYLYAVGGYLAALVVGMVVVGGPEWGLLLPLFWLPPLAFYLWYRAPRQPWWKPWFYGLFAAYAVWVFIWLASLTVWWAWWFPVMFVPFLLWWFTDHGYDWGEIRGPKWCFAIPFASIPFLAWWIPLWGPWWCFVIIVFFVLSLVCVTMNHFWEEEWWTHWLVWLVLIFVLVPFLLMGLWFFRPNWWWWPLVAWFPAIAGGTWWWARRQLWWQAWHLYVVGGYLAALVVGMVVVGAPEWGLLLPLFWLPLLAFWLRYRALGRPWWRPWMYGGVAVWAGVFLLWAGSNSLGPRWGLWYPVVLLPFLGWWFTDHGYDSDLMAEKATWLLPACLLPWLGFMVAIECIPHYYYGL